MNFLARCADVIDAKDKNCLSRGPEKNKLINEEEKYLIERGYIFSDKEQEFQLLNRLYDNELRNSASVYVLHLDTFWRKQSHLREILDSIYEMEKDNNRGLNSELIFYSKTLIAQSLNILDVVTFFKNCGSINLSTRIITTQQTLSSFQPLLSKGFVTDIILVYPLTNFDNSIFVPIDVERLLDKIIHHEQNVIIDVNVARRDVRNLRPLMNYFIYKGWPFLDNFECRLVPAQNETCVLGYWYSPDVKLLPEIFKVFRAYPQTEFFSLEKWIGAQIIHELIWKGTLPRPSFHFCDASKGQRVFTGDGHTFPCLRLAETFDDNLQKNGDKFKEILRQRELTPLNCRVCKYFLSCGGGCGYNAFTRNNGGVHCPPIKSYIEISLEHYFGEFMEKVKSLERR